MQRPKFNRSGISGMPRPHVVKRKNRKMKRSGTFHVYILECRDKTYYTGHTNDLGRRLKQHASGKGGARYTAWKKAGDLVWKKEYRYFKKAFLMEKRIKTLTRKQKELLVNGMGLDKVLGKKKCKNSGTNKAVKKDMAAKSQSVYIRTFG